MNALAGDQLPWFRRKPRMLFVGEDNSTHTQMAEVYVSTAAGSLVDVRSAGISSAPINRRMLAVMNEEGLDTHTLQSKLINAELLTWADIVVTMAATEKKIRVAIPSSARLKHWPIDPPRSDQDIQVFRGARDEVKRRTLPMINALRLFNRQRG